MEILNVCLSVISLIGALFVARAFLPHIPLRGSSPTAWLARAFATASATYFVRTIYRDIYLTLAGFPPDNPAFSAALNAALIVSEYCVLRARLESIPDSERSRWRLLTAPWYPQGPVVARRRRD